MTEQDVKDRVAAATKEYEENKSRDDQYDTPASDRFDDELAAIYWDVLVAIANGASNPIALAKAATSK